MHEEAVHPAVATRAHPDQDLDRREAPMGQMTQRVPSTGNGDSRIGEQVTQGGSRSWASVIPSRGDGRGPPVLSGNASESSHKESAPRGGDGRGADRIEPNTRIIPLHLCSTNHNSPQPGAAAMFIAVASAMPSPSYDPDQSRSFYLGTTMFGWVGDAALKHRAVYQCSDTPVSVTFGPLEDVTR